MANFTVLFKEKPINSYLFEQGTIRIGSDNSNEIQIDSLAVAPVHAVITINEDSCIVKRLSTEHPLLINDVASDECPLNDGYKLSLGKHTIIFRKNETEVPVLDEEFSIKNEAKALNSEVTDNSSFPEADLQIMNGKNIGRIIALKNAMTRFGKTGSGIAVITKRKDGFYISCLEQSDGIKVNGVPLADKVLKLGENDSVVVNETSMQLFLK